MRALSARPLAEGSDDYAALVAALTSARLPADDLSEGCRLFALHDGSEALAFGGIDGRGTDVMLRSIVVQEALRNWGLGRHLVRALIEEARSNGAERVWLLTTSATSFFEGLGWTVAERAEAPAAVRESRQFGGLCPSSAVLMCRTLA